MMKQYLWQGWRKFATLGIGIPAFLLISLLVYIKVAFPPEKIRSEAIAFLSEKLDRPIQVKSASLSLWPLGIELSGIGIGAPKDTLFSREALLELPSLVFKADLSEILLFKLRIKEIKISDLKLRYEVLADGRTNLDGLSKPDTGKTPSKPIEWSKLSLPGTFKMDAFTIKNASIIYVDRKAGREITLGELNENMSLSLDSTLENVKSEGTLAINAISIKDQALGLRQGGLKVSLAHKINANLRKQYINISELKAGLQNAEITSAIEVFNAFSQNLSAQAKWQTNTINLAEMFTAVPKNLHPELPKVQVSGMLNAQGEVQISDGQKPALQVKLKLSGMNVAHSDVPAKVQNLGFELSSNTESVELKQFSADLDGQNVKMNLSAHGLQSQPVLDNIDVNANVDLARLMDLAAKITPLPTGYKIAGQVKAQIQGSGPLDPNQVQNLKVLGDISLNNLQIRAPQVPEQLSYTGQVQISNTAIQQKGNLALGTTQVQQETKVSNYMAMVLPKFAQGKMTQVSAKINAPVLDIDKLLAILGGGSPKQETASAPMTSYPELPSNISADLAVNIGKAIAMGAEANSIQANINYTPNHVVAKWKAGIFNGNLSQNVDVQILNSKNATIRTTFDANKVDATSSYNFLADKLSDAPLHKELKKLKGIFHGTASINADLNMAGSPEQLSKTVDGKLTVITEDGRIDPCPQTASLVNAFNKGISTLQTWVPMVKEVQQLKMPNALTFHTFKSELYLEKGTFVVKDWNYEQNGIGLLLALGKIGIDTKLDMNMDYLIPASLSKKILDLQKSALDAAGKLNPLKGISLPQGLNALPVKDNRVLLPFLIAGTFANPDIKLDMNKMKMQGMDLKGALKDMLKAKADSLKALGLAKLNEEKAKLMATADKAKAEALAKANAAKAEAEAKANALRAEAEARAAAEKKKAEDKAKEELKNKSKDALKKFGF